MDMEGFNPHMDGWFSGKPNIKMLYDIINILILRASMCIYVHLCASMCIYVHLYFRSLTGGRMFCRQEKPRENLIHQHAIQKYNPIAAIACLNDFKCTVSPYITLGTVVPFGLATEKGAGATPLGTVIWKLRPLRLCTAREAFPLEFVEMPWIIWISGFSMFLYVSLCFCLGFFLKFRWEMMGMLMLEC